MTWDSPLLSLVILIFDFLFSVQNPSIIVATNGDYFFRFKLLQAVDSIYPAVQIARSFSLPFLFVVEISPYLF